MSRLASALFVPVFRFGGWLRGNRRPTHTEGFAARGALTVLRDVGDFQAGEVVPITLRFASVVVPDDAASDIRGAALAMRATGGARWDLVMNTGEVAFSNAWAFLALAVFSGPKPWSDWELDERGLRALFALAPRMRRQYAAGLVRAPESVTALAYHSQLPVLAPGGRLLRFRLAPTAPPAQPDPVDLRRPWAQARRADEERDPGYLAAELARHFGDRALWRLEMQEGTDPDPGEPWSTPWAPVGEVRLSERLGDVTAERLSFDIGRLPAGWRWPASRSLRDPASVAAVRLSVYRASRRARLRKGARRRALDALRNGPTGMRHSKPFPFLVRTLLFLLLDPLTRDRTLEPT